jgi:uncharacterized protein (TIGR00255 family)
MIRSMTGFGDAQREVAGHAYHVEIRTVNNRYFKPALRLPEDYGFAEADLERLLRQRLERGSVFYRLYVRDLSADAAYTINASALGAYLRQLQAAAAQAASAQVVIDLAQLAQLPGVCQPHELSDEEREARLRIATELTEAALAKLVAMRETEGHSLAEDLRVHLAVIAERAAAIKARVPVVVAEYRDRLAARVEQLIAKQNVALAGEDLAREVAIYADRSDISEELSRLASHVKQFEAALGKREAAGRKLEFLAQELLRETNTIGSKSTDAEVARHMLEMKSAVDRVKEQVLNVE